MNVKEQIAGLKSELESLKQGVEQQDETAIKRAGEIMNEIPQLEEKAAKADEAAALLKQIENPIDNQEANIMDTPKTIGELAVKSFAGKREDAGKFSLVSETGFKAAATITGTQINDYDRHGYQSIPETGIRGLFGTETISGNALTYYVLSDKDGAVATVAENGKKPQLDFSYTPNTVKLQKVAGYIVESDEIIEDSDWLASACDNRLLHKLALVEEAQLLTGNGTAPNITGLTNTSGIGSVTFTHGGTLSADDVLTAIMNVKANSGFDADAVIISSADLLRLMKAKDQNDQYLFSGPAYGAYGNGNATTKATFWGVPCYVSAALSAGQCIVGAFKQGASVVSKGDGIRLEATNTNGEDFVYNRVTIRAEERIALAVRYPAAFCYITEAAQAAS